MTDTTVETCRYCGALNRARDPWWWRLHLARTPSCRSRHIHDTARRDWNGMRRDR